MVQGASSSFEPGNIKDGFVESHPFAKSAKEWGTRRLKPQALKRGMILMKMVIAALKRCATQRPKSKAEGRSVRHAQEEMHRSFASLRMTRGLGFVESHPSRKERD